MVYRSYPFSGKPIITEYIYTRNSEDLVLQFEIISIQNNDTISYDYSRLYYSGNGFLDSTIVYNSDNRPVSKVVYKYDNSILAKMETFNANGEMEESEKYFYQTVSRTKRIKIVGNDLSKGYIKRIEIK